VVFACAVYGLVATLLGGGGAGGGRERDRRDQSSAPSAAPRGQARDASSRNECAGAARIVCRTMCTRACEVGAGARGGRQKKACEGSAHLQLEHML
jgi:hypothetical protein